MAIRTLLRTRRTKRSDNRLSPSVIRTAASPTKNRLGIRGSGAPRPESDPVASAVIAAVIVCPCLRGLNVEERPAGPAGRDRDDHRLADRPGDAEEDRGGDPRDGGRDHDPDARRSDAEPPGRTRPRAARREPRASRPRPRMRRAASTRNPTAIPAASRLNERAPENSFCTRSGLMTLSAKNPITTLGTLASVSRIGFSDRRGRGAAYSARYIAAPSPSGPRRSWRSPRR